MVGEGVLYEAINHPQVEKILIINRKPSGIKSDKIKEIIHQDFFNIDDLKFELTGYNTCFFCLGVSSVGMKEQEYRHLTHTLALNFARVLSTQNPEMTFCYISGAGTDSTEKGRFMWARVKGKTENDLQKLPFKKVYLFRPAVLKPSQGAKNTLRLYKYFSWLYPVLKGLIPNKVSTLKELGQAMIQVTRFGYSTNIIEVKDIHELAKDNPRT